MAVHRNSLTTDSPAPLEAYENAISQLDLSSPGDVWPESLLMKRDGDWASFYAPFEYVNESAKVVIVGITPGWQQAKNALKCLQTDLRAGASHEAALMKAKSFASFSGPMRDNLVRMLDFVGLPTALGLSTCHELFDKASNLAHFTSALRFPVTFRGENYSGTPGILKNAFTRTELQSWFASEVARIPEAIFLPLGPAVSETMTSLATTGLLRNEQILTGIPHPSAANAERIAYFLGRKSREALSAKTDPNKIDRGRESAIEAIRKFRSH